MARKAVFYTVQIRTAQPITAPDAWADAPLTDSTSKQGVAHAMARKWREEQRRRGDAYELPPGVRVLKTTIEVDMVLLG